MISTQRPLPLSITGIGSLPHTQLEMALQQALSTDVPYLPELPRRAPSEGFAAQALEALPGLRISFEGRVSVDFEPWQKGSFALDARLDEAESRRSVEAFSPTPASSFAWSPFLWEIGARKPGFVKIQCAGPATALAALAGGAELPEKLEQQVLRLVLARALAMARAIRTAGAIPVVFLDEPMIGAVRSASPGSQVRELEQLRATVLGLRNEGAIAGIHCCGEADWAPLLRLGLDVLSFDATTSLQKVLVSRPDVERFLETGGWLGLGVVPTDAKDARELDARLQSTLTALENMPKALRSRILSQSLLTPACGLGTRSVLEVGQVFEALRKAQQRLREIAKG